jgi:hypothetical protein
MPVVAALNSHRQPNAERPENVGGPWPERDDRLAETGNAAHAFEVPTTLPPGSLHDLLTIFLDPSVGKGGILNVVNDTGGPSTIANPDVPVTVVSPHASASPHQLP